MTCGWPRCARWLALGLAACTGDARRPQLPARHDRFGVLRDLVLIARTEAKGGPFFLDRFETSLRDMLEWLAATREPPPTAWPAAWLGADPDTPLAQRPAARIDLVTARAFARWRFCRLPTALEWEYAATAGGAYRFPWGDHGRPEWANTPGLGLGQAAPVGTFESGRSPGGPYDLVGNVAEWTETLDPAFLRDLDACARLPGLSVWSLRGAPAALFGLLLGAPTPPARVVVGGGYVGLSQRSTRWQARADRISELRTLDLLCDAKEWSDTTGMRLATDARTLLVALLAEREQPPEPSVRLLRTFLSEPAHRAVLAPAFAPAVARVGDPGALLEIVRTALRL
jgi:hypothetical protein